MSERLRFMTGLLSWKAILTQRYRVDVGTKLDNTHH